jgi:mannose-6-phosphate isomerase-like protein (cupin superfamily)
MTSGQRRVFVFELFTLLVALLNAAPNQSAVSQTTLSAGDVTNTALVEVLNKDAARPMIDMPVKTIDAGKGNVGVAIVKRTVAETDSIIHEKITEVYIIRSGAGSLLTGGTVVSTSPPRDLPIGPTIMNAKTEGGLKRRIGPNDVVIIPAGVPHRFAEVEGTLEYTVIRVDPDKVMPLQETPGIVRK